MYPFPEGVKRRVFFTVVKLAWLEDVYREHWRGHAYPRAIYFGSDVWAEFLELARPMCPKGDMVVRYSDATVHEWEELGPRDVMIEYSNGDTRIVTCPAATTSM